MGFSISIRQKKKFQDFKTNTITDLRRILTKNVHHTLLIFKKLTSIGKKYKNCLGNKEGLNTKDMETVLTQMNTYPDKPIMDKTA